MTSIPRYSIIFKGIAVAQGERVIEPDTIADDFGWESMTGIHKRKVANRAEAVRLFYIRVKLTIPRLCGLPLPGAQE